MKIFDYEFNLAEAIKRAILRISKMDRAFECMTLLLPILLILVFAFCAQTLSAQVSNDYYIKYSTQVHSVKWNQPANDGGNNVPEPRWWVLGRTSSALNYGDGCVYDWSSGTCFQVTNSYNEIDVNSTIESSTYSPPNRSLYYMFYAYESDYGGSGVNCVIAERDYAHCGSGSIAVKTGNQSEWQEYTRNGLNNWSTIKFRRVWRYYAGDSQNNALDFGTLNSSTKSHTNFNRQAPSGAPSYTGYSDKKVYYKFTIPSDGRKVIISTTTNYDEYIWLYSASGYITGSSSSITQDLCAGTYYVHVGSNNGSTGNFTLYVNPDPITVSPGSIYASNSTVCEGASIGYIWSNSGASAQTGVTYKWFKSINGGSYSEISGATSYYLFSSQSGTMPSLIAGQDNVRFIRKAYTCGNYNEVSTASVQVTAPVTNAAGGTIALNGHSTVQIGNDPGSFSSTINATAAPSPITIKWEKSEWNGSNWGAWTTISGAASQTYDIPNLNVRTRFRRNIRNNCGSSANSNEITVNAVPADGKINGVVTVGNSAVGVQGVTVTARRTQNINGGAANVTYSAITGGDGSYSIQNIYYGEIFAEYEVIASLNANAFLPADTLVEASSFPATANFQYVFTGGSILYVKHDAAGANNGSSWADAFTDLQSALDISNSDNNVKSIYIARGVYRPSKKFGGTDRHKTFYINRDVKIYGGFAGTETLPEDRNNILGNPTILSGDLADNDSDPNNDNIIESANDILDDGSTPQDNALHVVYIDHVTDVTLLDGLIITAGFANIGLVFDGRGGGIFNNASGAGLSSNPKINNCVVVGNAANYTGGGIHNEASSGSIIADYKHLEIRGNKANYWGGGIFNWIKGGSMNGNYYDCHFVNNYASYGGAMYNLGTGSTVNMNISHSTFLKNSASSVGGAVRNINIDGTNGIIFLNSSFSENIPEDLGSSNSKTILRNSILWGGSSQAIAAAGSPIPYVENGIVRGGYANGVNVVNYDPIFKSPQTTNTGSTIGGYLKLNLGGYPFDLLCSNAIDRGDNSFMTGILKDLDGNDRIQDGRPGGNPGGSPDGTEAIVDLGPYEISDPFILSATMDSSDSWVELSWSLDPKNCDCLRGDPNQQQGVFVELRHAPSGALVKSWQVLPENFQSTFYSDTYRDHIGPGITQDYRLEMRRVGPGTVNCHQKTTGRTKAFFEPVVTATDGIFPDSVNISWINNSWLSDIFKVYRGNQYIGSVFGAKVPGGTFKFSDIYRLNDTTSLVNGVEYTYKVETVSNQIGNTPLVLNQKGQDEGSTLPISFQASDANPIDQIVLNWQNMSAYCDQIRIIRQGVTIVVLPNSATTYTDSNPLFGQEVLYGIELLRNGQAIVGSYDLGSTLPNGIISGLVLTQSSNFPIKGATIQLSYKDERTGLNNTLTTSTDFTGKFEFKDLYYGVLDTFTLIAFHPPTNGFLEIIKTVFLDLANPTHESTIFYELAGYQKGAALHNLNSFTAVPKPTEDRVQIDWSHTPTPNKVTYFNLYRGSTLLTQVNDSIPPNPSGFSYSDLTGIPNYEYEYRLTAFQIMAETTMDTTVSVKKIFPKVAPVQVLNGIPNTSIGIIDLDWTHSSANFNGFRLYRNGNKIYEGKNTSFVDRGGRPNITEAYHIKSFRVVNQVDYESVAVDTIYRLYPDLPAVTVMTATPMNDKDLVKIAWTVPGLLINDYNYTGFNIYRKDQTTMITEKIQTINSFFATAGATLMFEDRTGIPLRSYVYEVKTFLKTATVDAEKAGLQAPAVFPDVHAPEWFLFNYADAKITFLWGNNSDNNMGSVIFKSMAFDSLSEIGVSQANPNNYSFIEFINGPEDLPLDSLYGIASFRTVGGKRYYSDTVTHLMALDTAGLDIKYITSFTATRNEANHVKLCWTWDSPSAKPDYVILREGIPIDTVPSATRAYYDYDAFPGVDILYSLYAYYIDPDPTDNLMVDESFQTSRVHALGLVPSGKSISGRVYKGNSGKGIADVDITARSLDPNFYSKVKTDAAGYYNITDLPEIDGRKTNSSDGPIIIPSSGSGAHVRQSIININQSGKVSDVNILNIKGNHTWMSDLEFRLIGPNGTKIDLLLNKCGNLNANFDVSFDDESANANTNIPCPFIGGTYKPKQLLSVFDGIEAQGNWILEVRDYFGPEDGGVLEGWTIQIFGLKYSIQITADSTNHAFEKNPQMVEVIASVKTYTADFIDTFTTPALDMKVTEMMALTATPNPQNISVVLNWSPINENYDGFEVYRGIELLAEVPKGNAFMWEDTKGQLGTLSMYYVRAFIFQNGVKVYSSSLNANCRFPILEPVQNLTLTPIEKENKVLVQWSHPYDSHSFYLIERNGIPIAAVNTGSPMIVVDSTGNPGEMYLYTVSAWKTPYQSDKVSNTITYPSVYYLNTLVATKPIDVSNESNSMNHVLLNWTYQVGAADSFMVIRYTKDGGGAKQNERILARTNGSARNYRDYTGEPGLLYYYEVLAIEIRNKQEYFSLRRDAYAKQIIFPDVAFANNRQAIANLQKGWMELKFKYLYPTVDSFVIKRVGLATPIAIVKIDTFQAGDEVMVIDANGVPDFSYTYEVTAYSRRNSIAYASVVKSFNPAPVVYPKIPQPIVLTASDGAYNNRIELKWEYDPEINIDGFRMKRKLPGNSYEALGDLVASGKRMYADGDANLLLLQPNDTVSYELEAFRDFQGATGKKYSLPTRDYGYLFSGRFAPVVDNESHNLGYSVSMSKIGIEDWAIVGSVEGVAYIYKKQVDGSWMLYQTLQPENIASSSFGRSVSISNEYAAIGAPYENTYSGAAYIFKYDSGTKMWLQQDRVISPNPGSYDQFGFSVDIIADLQYFLIVGAPYDDNAGNNSGSVYTFKKDGDDWDTGTYLPSSRTASEAQADANFGWSVAVGKATDGNYFSVIGTPNFDNAGSEYYGDAGQVYILKLTNSSTNAWTETNKLSPSDFFVGANQFGMSVDISKNLLIVGEIRYDGYSFKGAASIFTYNAPNWNTTPVVLTANPAEQYFGYAVSIISGDNANYALISENPSSHDETVYLYKQNLASWDVQSPVYKFENGVDNEFGRAVAISESDVLIGAPFDDNERGIDAGSIHFYPLGTPPAAVTSVNATDNAFPNKVTVSWSHPGTNVQQFLVIRDGQFPPVGTVAVAGGRAFDDLVDQNNMTPGKKHYYQIVAQSVDERLSPPRGDFGSILANGIISGKVTAKDGSSPIQGVAIIVKGTVDGEAYTYGPLNTNASGTYSFNQIYYGDGADFVVTPFLAGHTFDKDNETVTLTKTGTATPPQAVQINFRDQTAYTVGGIVHHADIPDCGMEGIEIEYLSVLDNGSIIKNNGLIGPIKTDATGAYSFVIDPKLVHLAKIIIRVKDTLLIGTGAEQDSAIFDFVAQGSFEGVSPIDGMPYFENFNTIAQINTINFIEQTRYEVNFRVSNTCGDALNNDKFFVRAFSRDGCFQKEILLNSDGTGKANYPPIPLVFAVSDINNRNAQNLVYLEALMNSPVNLDLFALHRDTSRDLTVMQMKDLLATSFIFHKAPTISANFASLGVCNEIGIITQDMEYTVPVSVSEQFAMSCNVSEGYLRITNGASANSASDTIRYDPDIMGFPDYVFKAGNPNVISPNIWNMSIEYYSSGNQFLGAVSLGIFVEGEIGIPGSGILLDASNNRQEVPLPLYVLRDPPGDNSFSSIESGLTVTKSVSYSKELGGSGAIKSNTEFVVVSVGGILNIEATLGGSDTKENTTEITTTTGKTISTSSDESAVGREADVIVGTGVAMQYGLKSRFSLKECTAEGLTIEEVSSLGLTPNGIGSTWILTVAAIEKLVEDYERDIQLIQSGAKVITENGKVLTKAVATAKYSVLRDNWDQVLEYHAKETNPFYYMATRDFRKQNSCTGGLANEWRDALLAMLDKDNNGKPDLDFTFDSTSMKKYNNAAYAIRNLLKFECTKILIFSIIPSEAYDYSYSDLRFNSNVFAPAENMAFNKTFAGQTSYTESYGQSDNFSNTLTSNFYSEESLEAGLKLDNEAKVWAGFGAGIINKLAKFETRATVTGTFNVDITNSTNTTTEVENKVSFTLSDNDPGDLINVTILRGVDMTGTPYFQTFGGFTSCPIEEGMIARDNPLIQVLDPVSGLPGASANLFFQQANQPAQFTIRVSNNSPTLDVADFEVFLDNASNPENATLSLAGNTLGAVSYTNQQPNMPLDLVLTVARGTSFDYTGLRIGIRPLCGGDEKFITLNVKFVTPCSPVTIVQPEDNWLLSSSIQPEELVIAIRDYNPNIGILDNFELQYRRLGSNPIWAQLPYPYLIDQNNPVSRDSMLSWNNAQGKPGWIPTYYFTWALPSDKTKFPDGEYELRVVATCKEGDLTSKTYSNKVMGNISRTRLQLFGAPQPSDGVWIPGDLIAASFNKNVDCVLFDDPAYVSKYMKVEVDGNVIPNANFTCFGNEVRVTLPDMTLYDGKRMFVTLDSIVDPSGNLAINIAGNSRVISWNFLVVTSKAYWEQDSLVVSLYEGDTLHPVAGLRNTDLQISLSNVHLQRTTGSSAWLSTGPAIGSNFAINPGAVKPIDFTIYGTAAGTYFDTIKLAGIAGGGIVPKLPVKVVVRKRPPYPPNWQVDGNVYPNSMTVVANFKYEGATDYSKDPLDQISVFMGKSLRGLANIQKVGDNYYVAYITVYGSAADNGKSLEFRVWDADVDLEFDGHPESPDTVKFAENQFRGSSDAPIILKVNQSKDLARYIPLNQGWTWFSLNSVEDNMSTKYILRGLQNATPGDRILSQNHFGEYINDSIGWHVPERFVGDTLLQRLKPSHAYMIYLANGPDTIRITGANAVPQNRVLFEGWTWVGFPLQVDRTLSAGISVINIQPGDQIRSKDFAAVRTAGNAWDGSLTNLTRHQGYKIQINTGGAVLMYNDPGTPLRGDTENDEKMISLKNSNRVAADPNDESTWVMGLEEIAYQDVVPVVGEVTLDAVAQTSGKIAAFIGSELVGVANIVQDPVLNKAIFTLLIGINNAADLTSVQLHFATTGGTEYPVGTSYTYANNELKGIYTYSNILPISLTGGSGGPCTESIMTLNNDPIASDSYRAIDQIISAGVIRNNATVEFRAGTSVEMNANFEVQTGSQLLVIIEPCQVSLTDKKESTKSNSQKASRTIMKKELFNPIDLNIIGLKTGETKRYSYVIENESSVSISVFNKSGEGIRKVADAKHHLPGKYDISFSAAEYGVGTLYVRILTEDSTGKSERLILKE